MDSLVCFLWNDRLCHFPYVKRIFIIYNHKKDPVYTKAKIVSYVPKTPDEMGEVDIVMTYSFIADEKTYIKEQQALNIKTLDLDKYYVGKEVPIVYYRKNPNYSKIDVYDKSLRN